MAPTNDVFYALCPYCECQLRHTIETAGTAADGDLIFEHRVRSEL